VLLKANGLLKSSKADLSFLQGGRRNGSLYCEKGGCLSRIPGRIRTLPLSRSSSDRVHLRAWLVVSISARLHLLITMQDTKVVL
jgi:hypothetical protein